MADNKELYSCLLGGTFSPVCLSMSGIYVKMDFEENLWIDSHRDKEKLLYLRVCVSHLILYILDQNSGL